MATDERRQKRIVRHPLVGLPLVADALYTRNSSEFRFTKEGRLILNPSPHNILIVCYYHDK